MKIALIKKNLQEKTPPRDIIHPNEDDLSHQKRVESSIFRR
jgi:hypothetical protein